jgi:FkbM family methyltransferase
MKNQSGVFWERNKAYFDKKWMTVSGGTVRIPHPERNAYHSEYQEDEWLNNHIFLGQRKGVFFECGAIDGIVHSNSLFFERALGWTGLCIEPNPDEFEKLKKNRICKAENYALWPEENKTIDFQKIKGGLRGWSAITESIEEQQKERIKTNIKPEDIEIIKVPTIRLSSILKKHGMKNIDFVSLDIEGAELDVLKDFPFDQFDIKIFLIENNFNNNSIEKIMNKAGYKKIIRLGVTDIYRKLEKKTLDSGISFARKVEAMNRIEELKKIPRVPLPDDVPDDDHNRIEGLLEMIVGYFPKNASVVELGTGRGVSTEVFALLCEKVITTDIKNDLKGDWSNAAAKVFLKYDNIKHFNMTSTKLASIMPDNSFDAVYIDAAHEYEAVKEDIMKWRPKIKKGGIICGHDYIDRPKYNFGIIRAVDEIFGKPDMVFKDTSWMVKLF